MLARPNVLFVFTDQQSIRAMGAYGNPHVRTQHMDALAEGGIRFELSYCAAPVSGPSRAALVTGRFPHEVAADFNGLSFEPGEPTMGEIFAGAGYETAWAGKWHIPKLYPLARRGGEIPGFEVLLQDIDPSVRYGRGDTMDSPTTDVAIEFLNRRRDRPFLLVVSWHNPHDICGWIQPDIAGLKDTSALPLLPDNFEISPDEPEFIRTCRERPYYGPEGLRTKHWSEAQWRQYLRAYYDFTEQVDVELGRLMHALRETGQDENTLIIFTSDHGEGMAAHRWVVKLMLYDEPAMIPFVLRHPAAIPEGRVDASHLVSGVDVLPTLCDYAGIDLPPRTGMSVRPWIDDPDSPGREYLVCELSPDTKRPEMRARMVRTRRFKYIAFSEGESREALYDMAADPGETQNVAGLSEHENIVAQHRAHITEWIEKTRDDFAVPGD